MKLQQEGQRLDLMKSSLAARWLDTGKAPEGGGEGFSGQPQEQETFPITLGSS